MGPVVCCVDGSDLTRAIVEFARGAASRRGAPLILLNVRPGVTAPGVSAASAGQARLRELELADAAELLERVALDAALPGDTGRRAEVAHGSIGSRIVEVCADEDASLVVVGSHGRGAVKRALLGSVSTEVAAHAPCPCVVVSPAAAERLTA
jgi:nucleotide-binding universal stress UspA family protein